MKIRLIHTIRLIVLVLISGPVIGQTIEWTDRVSSNGNNYVFNVQVDQSTNDIYATGRVKSLVTFGELSSSPATPDDQGDRDIYLTKHDESGELIWVKRFGGLYTDYGRTIEISDDYIYLGGHFTDTCFVGDDTLFSNGDQDICLIKLDKDGNVIWTKSWGGPGIDQITESYLVDNEALVFVGGYEDSISFDGEILLNTVPTTYINRESAFVIKTDSSANVVWAENIQSTHKVRTEDVLYKDGYIYVVGNCYGTTEFGGVGYPSVNLIYYDQFLTKYDEDGGFTWAQLYSYNWNDTFTNIDQDEDDLYITGTFKGVVTYGSTTYDTDGIQSGIVLKADTSGTITNSYKMETTDYGYLDGITVMNNNRIFVGGFYSDSLFIMSDTVLSNGAYDIVMIELSQDMEEVDYYVLGGPSHDQIRSMAHNSNADVVIAGSYRQTVDFETVTFTSPVNTYDGFISSLCPNLQPDVFISKPAFCVNDTLVITNNTYGELVDVSWENSAGTVSFSNQDSVGIVMDSPGLLTVKVVLEGSCDLDSVEFVDIEFFDLPSISLGDDTTFCAPEEVTVYASGDFDSLYWSTGEFDQDSVVVNSSMNLTVEAWNDEGCSMTDTVVINVLNCIGIAENPAVQISYAYHSNGIIFVAFENDPTTSLNYAIYDLRGQVIQTGQMDSDQIYLNQKFPTGLYLLSIRSNNQKQVFKLTID